MRLSDKEIQDAIKAGKKIKRIAWGECHFVKHIKHAHIPSRQAWKFQVDDNDIDDWVICDN